jgi:hypothetical protein
LTSLSETTPSTSENAFSILINFVILFFFFGWD